MSNILGDALRRAREFKGITLEQASTMLGVSNQAINQWEMGKTRPNMGRLEEIAKFYELDAVALMRLATTRLPAAGEETPLFPSSDRRSLNYITSNVPSREIQALSSLEPNAQEAPNAPTETLEAQIYLPLDVPVLGVSMGGDGYDFQFNGETVDHVRRPLGIAKAKRAYATYVVGESMVPAFREGAVLFVNPDRPPSIGDDVVIELHPTRDGEPGPGYIKRLKKRTATKVIVEQFNPPQDLEFEWTDIKAMHRVVPWNELLGI